MARKAKIQVMTVSCRRGCGKKLTTLNRPVHSTAEDYRKYSGICENCLTDEERADMNGPMLHRTARNILNGGY